MFAASTMLGLGLVSQTVTKIVTDENGHCFGGVIDGLVPSLQSAMRIALVLLVLAACGGGDDIDRAQAVADANKVADLSSWNIQWVSADDLTHQGHPELVGFTDPRTRTIWISASHPSMLVHEALHVAHPGEPNHCTWSLRFLAVHMTYGVRGSFTDDCNHVLCASKGDGHYWRCSY